MAWIPMVAEEEATGILAELYARARKRYGFVPDAVRVFSLRPEVAEAVDQIRQVLLGPASSLGARRADLIGTAVSGLNHCRYCGTAHAGLLARRGDLAQEEAIRLYRDWRAVELSNQDRTMLEFAEKLTFSPGQMTAEDVERLREEGFSDVEILDIVLLTAYRNFMNRVNDGLGVPVERLRAKFGDDLVDIIGGLEG